MAKVPPGRLREAERLKPSLLNEIWRSEGGHEEEEEEEGGRRKEEDRLMGSSTKRTPRSELKYHSKRGRIIMSGRAVMKGEVRARMKEGARKQEDERGEGARAGSWSLKLVGGSRKHKRIQEVVRRENTPLGSLGL